MRSFGDIFWSSVVSALLILGLSGFFFVFFFTGGFSQSSTAGDQVKTSQAVDDVVFYLCWIGQRKKSRLLRAKVKRLTSALSSLFGRMTRC